MKNAKIFLVDDKVGNLTAMVETGYVTEDVLQAFLAKYPDLLAGDQIDPENPRRWLLVTREMGVPGDVTETGRWSLDHLFLDQDGMPTFVECKRSVDTRARREVVAQMLDYAANGTEYWSLDRLRQAAAETANKRKHDLDDDIRQLLDTDQTIDIDDFWKTVESNLKTGKVRLIFVADEIPRELRRLVEFLNEKMTDVEVLAVEVKQYEGEGQKALVPRVIGATETARSLKAGGGPRARVTQDEFLAKCPPVASKFLAGILHTAESKDYVIYWGTVGFSIRARLQTDKPLTSFFYGWPQGQLDVYLRDLPLPENGLEDLRKRLLSYKVFRPGGDWTLKAMIEESSLSGLQAACDLVMETVDSHLISD